MQTQRKRKADSHIFQWESKLTMPRSSGRRIVVNEPCCSSTECCLEFVTHAIQCFADYG